MKTRYWIILILTVFVVSLFACVCILRLDQATYAEVYVDGTYYCTLPLNEDTELRITTDYGTNTIVVKDGSAAITDASCPDKLCEKQGFRSGGMPIVCLPNRVVVQFTGESELDATAG